MRSNGLHALGIRPTAETMAYTIMAVFTYGSPEQRDKVIPILRAHRARCLADEPGTLEFEISIANDDDTKVMFYEVYESREAFEAHWRGASVRQAIADTEAAGLQLVATASTHGTKLD